MKFVLKSSLLEHPFVNDHRNMDESTAPIRMIRTNTEFLDFNLTNGDGKAIQVPATRRKSCPIP
jgi:hypothetical protein